MAAVDQLRKMLPIALSRIKKDFEPVQTDSYFGLARRDLASFDLGEIIEEGRNYTDRSGWRHDRFHIKRLGSEETFGEIPKRFENGLLLEDKGMLNFPKTYGLLFEGNWHDKVLRNAPAYVIADYIEGPTLMSEILSKRLQEGDERNMLKCITRSITQLRSDYIYLLDFAPRDIIINGCFPHFVDFEDVAYSTSKNNPGLVKRQAEQFIEDYKIFFRQQQLEEALEDLRKIWK